MIDPNSIDLASLPTLPLEYKSLLPEVSCIYFAIDSKGTVQYIGRTKNLKQRWAGHHRIDDLTKHSHVRVAYLAMEADLLSEVEQALIAWFKPVLNGFIESDATKQPKAKVEAHGQKKTEHFQVLFTATGLEKLDALATRLNLSRSRNLERSVQWIDEHFDGQLQRDLGDRA